MTIKLIALTIVCAALHGQGLRPAIDNERVTVWDMTWTKGAAYPGRDNDRVVMWLTGAHAGTASFIPKGGERAKGGSAGDRSLIIELKDHPVPPLENKTGYPLAFPRPHVKKLLENDRV